MHRTLTSIFIVLALLVLASAGSLQADTLHGFCVSVSCSDNGTVTPVSTGTFTFGFSADPGPTTGTGLLVVLSLTNLGSSINLGAGSATLNGTQWTSGFLDTFLGFNGQPNNGFANYSGLDGGAGAFFVYTLNLGTQTVVRTKVVPSFQLLVFQMGLSFWIFLLFQVTTLSGLPRIAQPFRGLPRNRARLLYWAQAFSV